MVKRFGLFMLGLSVGMVVSACDVIPNNPSSEYESGEIVFEDYFNQPYNWDYINQQDVLVEVRNGRYWMRSPYNSFVRGFNTETHENVVIEVIASQVSTEETNAYGVVCRGSVGTMVSRGYYFLIGGDGSYSIRIGRGGEIEPLVAWARSSAINRGIADNIIRVVCVDDYLALYVNNEFVADVRDDRFASGFAGFAVATREGTLVEVSFDNLTIWEATLIGNG